LYRVVALPQKRFDFPSWLEDSEMDQQSYIQQTPWRWMLDRDYSSWHPTLRLFRRKALVDWEPVFHQVSKALADS